MAKRNEYALVTGATSGIGYDILPDETVADQVKKQQAPAGQDKN